MPHDNKNDLLAETMIDIAYNAGCMVARGQIAVEDSREFVSTVRELAGEFEKAFDLDGDYIAAVDTFAEEKLLQLYGPENMKEKANWNNSTEHLVHEMTYKYTGLGSSPPPGGYMHTSKYTVFNRKGEKMGDVTLYHKTGAAYVEIEPFEQHLKPEGLYGHWTESLYQSHFKGFPFRKRLEMLGWHFDEEGTIIDSCS